MFYSKCVLFLTGNYFPQCQSWDLKNHFRDWGTQFPQLTLIQREHLSSQSRAAPNALNSISMAGRLYLHGITDQYPRCIWSPYWHWQLARLRSRLSICLINAIYLKCTDQSMSRKEECDNEKWRMRSSSVGWSKKGAPAMMNDVQHPCLLGAAPRSTCK